MDASTVASIAGGIAGGPVGIAMALGQFVPGILKLFGGSDKTVDIANHVVGVAQAITGTGTPQEAMAVLQADPNKVLEFQQAMGAQQADMEKAYLADTGNARAMQTAALGQDDLFSKRFVYYLAAGWSLFAMLYFTGVTFIKIEPAGQRVADTVLGVLISSVLGSVMAYFYGTTKGSAEKTRIIAQQAK